MFFFQTDDSSLSLEELGSKQLFPSGSINTIEELKKLNRKLLQEFLRLIQTLISNAAEANLMSQVEEITLIFVNMHYLLNTYRPHQARQTLISQLEEQIERRKQQTETILQ